MTYTLFESALTYAVSSMFEETFTASEGAEEGALIARLSGELAALSEGDDVFGFVAQADGRIAGAVFMSRIPTGESKDLFLLSPVAVHPDFQRQGVGKALIRRSLERLKTMDISLCVTYGDPAYYAASGFESVEASVIPPPHPLSMPFGWLAVPVSESEVRPVAGPTSCVAPFDDPALW